MTNFGRKKSKCSKCKKTTEVTVLVSTNSFGSSDLDTRPAEMERSTMIAWIEKCEHCGYCASDIETENEVDPNFMKSAQYVEAQSKAEIPELARDFICAGLCNESIGIYSNATMDYLNASWVCDDRCGIHSPQSKQCREKVIQFIDEAIEKKQSVIQPQNAELLLKIDALRRIEKFDEAIAVANHALTLDFEEFLKQVCKYQIQLSNSRDSDVHTMSEVSD